jgi:hypothetical protein
MMKSDEFDFSKVKVLLNTMQIYFFLFISLTCVIRVVNILKIKDQNYNFNKLSGLKVQLNLYFFKKI